MIFSSDIELTFVSGIHEALPLLFLLSLQSGPRDEPTVITATVMDVCRMYVATL